MFPMETYQYRPLMADKREIRLFTIGPSTERVEELQIFLEHHTSRALTPYVALSYRWGPTEPESSILVDGRVLKVSRNLYAFLSSLRTRGLGDPLWADAICINQNDVYEKNHQVQLMREIYSNAERVFCWLGNPVHTTVTNEVSLFSPFYHTLKDLARLQHIDTSANAESLLDPLLSICSRPYWDRVWIIQEFTFARNIILIDNSGELPWTTFNNLFTFAIDRIPTLKLPIQPSTVWLKSIENPVRRIRNIRATFPVRKETETSALQFWKSRHQLVAIMESLSRQEAIDERDRIFALGDLISPFGITLPKVDYSKSYAEVIRAAKRMVLRGSLATTHNSSRFCLVPFSEDQADSNDREEGQESETKSRIHTAPEALADFCRWYTCLTLQRQQQALLVYMTDRLADLSTDTRLHLDQSQGQPRTCTSRSSETKEGGDSGVHGQSNATQGCAHLALRKRARDRPNDDDDNDDNDEDERENVRKQRKRAPKALLEKFAWPFFQRNFRNDNLHNSCHGPGFPDVHRLKEHLARAHRIHPCPRCGDCFKDQTHLDRHLISATRCNTWDWAAVRDYDLGFSSAQEKAIKKVRGANAWQNIYHILFPDDPESAYPSPYQRDAGIVQCLDDFVLHYQMEAYPLIDEHMSRPNFLTSFGDMANDEAFRAAIRGLIMEVNNAVVRSFRMASLGNLGTPNVAMPSRRPASINQVVFNYLDALEAENIFDTGIAILPSLTEFSNYSMPTEFAPFGAFAAPGGTEHASRPSPVAFNSMPEAEVEEWDIINAGDGGGSGVTGVTDPQQAVVTNA